MKLFLQSTKEGKEATRFEIKAFDPETKRGVIIGGIGVEFETDLSKENLVKYGYKVVKEGA